jgi:hypothetical protein
VRRLVVSFSPGFWRNILNLPVSHGRQPAQNVAEVSVGFDPAATAALNDRVDDRATFSRGGVSEKEPILFSESGRSDRVLHQIIVDFNLSVLEIDFQRFPLT